jgi:hypothetical protein
MLRHGYGCFYTCEVCACVTRHEAESLHMLGRATVGDGSVTLRPLRERVVCYKMCDLYTFLSAGLYHEPRSNSYVRIICKVNSARGFHIIRD